jgi:hypothetical protein
MDRRQERDLRRPMTWDGPTVAARQLPSPPQHEWLEAVNYWKDGGSAPVWFVADPLRADIDLINHSERTSYRWGLPYPVLIDGVRPNEIDWYRIDRPDWFVGEGWSLTPESAGVSDADRRGLANGPITGWIEPRVLTDGCFVIGGRNLEPAVRPTFTVSHDRMTLTELVLPSGPFVVSTCPSSGSEDQGRKYRELQVDVRPRSRVAVEQFDASSDRTVFGFGDGWHEPEYNPANGARWRWLGERGELQLSRLTREPLVLHIEGESPRRYFGRPSRLLVRGRDRVVLDLEVTDDFTIDVPLSAETIPDGIITLETNQVYVPADRSWRTKDRRRLGLRIFRCELRRTPPRAS